MYEVKKEKEKQPFALNGGRDTGASELAKENTAGSGFMRVCTLQ